MRTIFTVVALLSTLAAQVYSESEQGHGLIPPTQKDWDHIHKYYQKIETVRPNQLGAARIKIDYERRGETAPKIEVAQMGSDEFAPASGGSNYPFIPVLPAIVSNNELPCFPYIGNQGGEGSCVPWATTYYQATHEVGLVNGFQNQGYLQNVLSPSWTYNMINGGQDNGSQFTNAYALLAQNGAPTNYVFPYVAGKYLAWDLKTQDWVSALSNRLNPFQYVAGLNSSPQNLNEIKMLLANGHVLTFGTYMNSWVYSKIGPAPGVSMLFAGELAVSYMSPSEQGSHMATIVGYNDYLWIDINGNGKVDPGETGAFLVANSWGANWGNGGFVWMAYDAFLANSAVTPPPTAARQPLAILSNSYALLATAKATNYQPSLVATFGLAQTERDHISISAGVSSTSQTTPAAYFHSGAIIDQGGLYDFAGAFTSTPQSGTFCLDLTDLVPLGNRYYLVLANQLTPTTLQALSLIDLVNDVVVPVTSVQLPQTTTWNTLTPYIDYTIPSVNPNPAPAKLCWPANNQTVSGMMPLLTNAPSTIDSVTFYIDSKEIVDVESVPYIWFYDTTTLTNGSHQVSAVFSYRRSPVGQAAVTVTVQN